jgi:hypothetical protein
MFNWNDPALKIIAIYFAVAVVLLPFIALGLAIFFVLMGIASLPSWMLGAIDFFL